MRIMLDECVTQGPSEILIQFFQMDGIEAAFLVEHFGKQGVKDSSWAKALMEEGDWCVITADRGRKKKNTRLSEGPPLHKILPACDISGVYMSGSVQNSRGAEKVRAVTSTWPDIKSFFVNGAPGSRMLLAKATKGFSLREYP